MWLGILKIVDHSCGLTRAGDCGIWIKKFDNLFFLQDFSSQGFLFFSFPFCSLFSQSSTCRWAVDPVSVGLEEMRRSVDVQNKMECLCWRKIYGGFSEPSWVHSGLFVKQSALRSSDILGNKSQRQFIEHGICEEQMFRSTVNLTVVKLQEVEWYSLGPLGRVVRNRESFRNEIKEHLE